MMVQANELRIGNWFILNGFPMYVDAIYSDMVSLDFKGNESGSWEEYIKDLNPIPLTEEILLKCGFGEVGVYDNVYHKGDFRIYLDEVHNTGLVRYERKDGKYNLEKEIASVHQLQNLYFELTGEELEVKLC